MMKFVPEYIKKVAFAEYGDPLKVPQKQLGSITRVLWMQFMIRTGCEASGGNV